MRRSGAPSNLHIRSRKWLRALRRVRSDQSSGAGHGLNSYQRSSSMKVLIVGSTHGKFKESDRSSFEQACRELGIALASAGVEIVLGSDGANTADRYVLEGAATVKQKGKHRVWMLRPESQETPPRINPKWVPITWKSFASGCEDLGPRVVCPRSRPRMPCC